MEVPIIKPVLLTAYLLLILTGLLVPSTGSHGLLHPKSVAFVSFTSCFVGYLAFFKRVLTKDQMTLLFCAILFIAFSTLFFILGLLHPRIEPVLPFDQFKLFIITGVVVITSLFLYLDKILSFSLFLKTLLFGNFFYVLFKMVGAFALTFKIITFDKLTALLGIQAVGMAIFGDFQRLQTSMDISTPFLIFFCLESERFGVKLPRWFKWTFAILGFVSTVVSFSRVLIFTGAVSFVLYFCLHNWRHFLVGSILAFSALCGGVALIGPNNAMKMVEMRLFSHGNSQSDRIRSIQIEALTEEIAENPLFGMGMGGYSEKEIRDRDIKHSYEVQWVALLAQLGFLGLFCFLLPILFFTLELLKPPIHRDTLAIAVLWIGWITSGLTNPFVISLTSGILYSLFALGLLQLKGCRYAKV